MRSRCVSSLVEGFDRFDRTVDQPAPVDEVSGRQIDAQAIAEINHILNATIRNPIGLGLWRHQRAVANDKFH